MGDAGSQHLGSLLDALPERVARYRLDDLTVTYCNVAKAEEYGLTPDELIGRRLDEVQPPEVIDALWEQLASLSAEQPMRTTVVTMGERVIEWVDQLLPGDDGPEVLSVGRDVTDRVDVQARLREAEHRFTVAMDDAPIGVAIVAMDGRLQRVNRALCEFLERDEEELLGLTSLDVTHPDDVATDLAYGRQLVRRAPGPAMLEKRFVRGDGTVVWGLLRVSVVRDDDERPLYQVAHVVDIDERVSRETALHRVAADQRDVAQHLRQLDQMKNTFLTAVSHELRTPLTAVQGFAELLQARHRHLSADQIEDLLGRLARNATRLGGLLADLLELDRLLEGTALEPRRYPTRLVDLVHNVLGVIDAGERRITTDLEDVEVAVDPPKIERIIENLVTNALRHTDGSADVTIRIARDGDGALLSVEDGGPGVPDDLKDSIFEPFAMGTNDATKVGGTGIGLAIVVRFAAMHGGRAWVEDRRGGGAAFRVWLPVTEARSPAQPHGARTAVR